MAEITYLIGAGASVNSIPIVSEFTQGLDDFAFFLRQPESILTPNPTSGDNWERNKAEFQQELINDLDWLVDLSKKHASIDTVAKKFFLTDKTSDLRKLKGILSTFLLYKQYVTPIDKRYDTFLASILNIDLRSFPSNIRILSWNYDLQFELAMSSFEGGFDVYDAGYLLNRITANETGLVRFDIENEFSLIKINGSAMKFQHSHLGEESFFLSRWNFDNEELLIEDLVKNYSNFKSFHPAGCSLTFAWETVNQIPDKSIVNFINKATKNTTVLVVIGYSFPFFNRDVDRAIIDKMTGLKKVYIQDKKPARIKDRFGAITDIVPVENIVLYRDTDQFLLPNEL